MPGRAGSLFLRRHGLPGEVVIRSLSELRAASPICLSLKCYFERRGRLQISQGGAAVTATSGASCKIAPRAEVHCGGAEVIDRFAAEWRTLCEQGPSEYPFYRPEWIRAHVRAFAPHSRVILITARAGGRLAAVLPLVEETGFYCGLPVRKLRGAANWHSCRFDLVRTEGPEGDAAVLSVWESLRLLPDWHLLELSDVPQAGALEQLVCAARAAGFPVGRSASIRSPYVPIAADGNVEEWWPDRASGKFRKDLRRAARNLNAQGEVRLSRVSEASAEILKQFYELERSGWKGREGTAIACSPATQQFYDEITREAQRFGYLSFYFLECSNHALAAHFGLSYRGRYFMPKVAYDEQYERYAPGHLLMGAILRDCVKRGIREYDCLGPDQSWKMKWTTAVRPHSCFYIFRNGLYPQALWAARFRALPVIRKVLSRYRLRAQETPDVHSRKPS